jgi:hypothetical protein
MLKKILLNLAALFCGLIMFAIFPNQKLLNVGLAPEWVGLLKVLSTIGVVWVFMVCFQKRPEGK